MSCTLCHRDHDESAACAPVASFKPKVRHGRGFPARYDGRCHGCGDPIEVGDDIVMDGGIALHAECGR